MTSKVNAWEHEWQMEFYTGKCQTITFGRTKNLFKFHYTVKGQERITYITNDVSRLLRSINESTHKKCHVKGY